MYTLVGNNFIRMIQSFYPTAKSAAGGSECTVRCPFCGDSENIKSQHLYIKVPTNEHDLPLYHCKRCNAKGIVDDNFLRTIGCNDNNTLIEISKHNEEVLKLPKYQTLKKIDIYPLRYNYIRPAPRNQSKLNYINNRIGANFTEQDLPKLKIFLNLYDILNSNNLELTRSPDICKSLDTYFIGFISYDNSYCGMRNLATIDLYKSINKRYINYSLIDKPDNSKDYYVIPSTFDILNPNPVNIHLAEGQFDILSIFYNLCNSNSYQNIYIACGGKSYAQALQFILSETGVINYNIHYYPDADVYDREFQKIINTINALPTKVFIHRNLYPNEKDFGVPLNRIKDGVREV